MENKGVFTAGYGRVDITPDYSVPLAGWGNSERRMSERVLDHVYAVCVAMTDGDGQTLLMYQYDNVKVRDEIYEAVTKHFAEKHGIDAAYIHITATHSESSPDTYNEKVPVMKEYLAFVIASLIEAGEQALADRSPAAMEYGTTRTRNLNFVKHVFLSTGVAIGDNHGSPKDGKIVRHTTQVDDLMLVLRLRREGKKDIAMVNWRAHDQMTSGQHKTDLSADYVGSFRAAAEEKFGCLFAYYQGCCGNVNPYSYIRSEQRTRDYLEYGKFLTEHMNDIYDHLTPVPTGKIKAERLYLDAEIDHSLDGLLEPATAILNQWREDNDNAAAIQRGKPYGIYSAYHAMAIVRRAGMPQRKQFDYSVWTVGRLGFACCQYETFDTNGKFVRDNSPYDMTFVMGYTDHASGYLASAYAHEYGCYEVDNGIYAAGTGERLASCMVEKLVDFYYENPKEE